jgi:hypothetical protein
MFNFIRMEMRKNQFRKGKKAIDGKMKITKKNIRDFFE